MKKPCIEDEYTRLFADLIDHVLGLRSKFLGYRYSEIFRACNVYEKLNALLPDMLFRTDQLKEGESVS